jgi:hypothetical protein
MLNLAGPAHDLGDVLFAVLQECEHARRAFAPAEAAERLREIARAKLDEIHESYEECGGTETYWRLVEREVLETALPQYIPAAVEQTRLEASNYDLWRKGDPLARAAYGLLGLVIGSLIILAPWIPIFEDTFAFVLALAGFLYPEIRKTAFDYRHSRLLNRLIVQAEKYQRNEKIQYMSEGRLQEELEAVGRTAPRKTLTSPAPPLPARHPPLQGEEGKKKSS